MYWIVVGDHRIIDVEKLEEIYITDIDCDKFAVVGRSSIKEYYLYKHEIEENCVKFIESLHRGLGKREEAMIPPTDLCLIR
jgi:L-cysteine desulfidase